MIDYSLYLVTDNHLARGRSTEDIVEAAVAGGVTCVQIREKKIDTRAFVAQAKELKKLLQPLGIPLIVNDRLDVALAANADGIHLGQTDMTIEDARRIAGDDIIIGISAESLQDAINAQAQGADYIGISPVFTTDTKKDIATPQGLDGLFSIRKQTSIPLVAIGGINKGNIKSVIQAGADGIAVVSAIVSADSPEFSARELLNLISNARTEKQ